MQRADQPITCIEQKPRNPQNRTLTTTCKSACSIWPQYHHTKGHGICQQPGTTQWQQAAAHPLLPGPVSPVGTSTLAAVAAAALLLGAAATRALMTAAASTMCFREGITSAQRRVFRPQSGGRGAEQGDRQHRAHCQHKLSTVLGLTSAHRGRVQGPSMCTWKLQPADLMLPIARVPCLMHPHIQAHSSAPLPSLHAFFPSPGLTQTLSYWPLSTPLSTKPWIFSISQSTSGTCGMGGGTHNRAAHNTTLSQRENEKERGGEERREESKCQTYRSAQGPLSTSLEAPQQHPQVYGALHL